MAWVDSLQRAIEQKVKEDTGVEMLAVSVSAINIQSQETEKIKKTVQMVVSKTEGAQNIRGFYIDVVDKTMNFDVAMEFDVEDEDALRDELLRKLEDAYEDYDIKITMSHDFMES